MDLGSSCAIAATRACCCAGVPSRVWRAWEQAPTGPGARIARGQKRCGVRGSVCGRTRRAARACRARACLRRACACSSRPIVRTCDAFFVPAFSPCPAPAGPGRRSPGTRPCFPTSSAHARVRSACSAVRGSRRGSLQTNSWILSARSPQTPRACRDRPGGRQDARLGQGESAAAGGGALLPSAASSRLQRSWYEILSLSHTHTHTHTPSLARFHV